jgi:Fe2+ or Zn2+ uptake regulation protein
MSFEHEFIKHCNQRGMEPTRKCLRVVRLILSRPKTPFHVEEILPSFRDEQISRSTLYRALTMLVSFGILFQPDPGELVYHFIPGTDDLNDANPS